jgi:hypothetical protein
VTITQLIFVGATVGGIVVAGLVTLLKGQYLVFVLGLAVAGMIWVVAACRLARPGSYWEGRFYGADKQGRVRHRYGH